MNDQINSKVVICASLISVGIQRTIKQVVPQNPMINHNTINNCFPFKQNQLHLISQSTQGQLMKTHSCDEFIQ